METVAAPSVRVLIVDDHEVVRSGLIAVLTRDHLQVVGAVATAEQALTTLRTQEVDVVLMDHRLPGLVGPAACAEIVRRHPDTRVVALTCTDDAAVVHAFLAAGASGYLVKDAMGGDIAAAVRTVARGGSVIAAQVVGSVVELARRARGSDRSTALAPQELTVLSLAAQGCTNREIASRVGVSEGTVKADLKTIMRKLGARERAQAVAAGIRLGVI